MHQKNLSKWSGPVRLLCGYLAVAMTFSPVLSSGTAWAKTKKDTPATTMKKMEKAQKNIEKNEKKVEKNAEQIEKLEAKIEQLESRLRSKTAKPGEKDKNRCDVCATYVARCNGPMTAKDLEDVPQCEKGGCKVSNANKTQNCYEVYKNEGCRNLVSTGDDIYKLDNCWLVKLEKDLEEAKAALEAAKIDKEELESAGERLSENYDKLEENCVTCGQALAQKALMQQQEEIYGQGGILATLNAGGGMGFAGGGGYQREPSGAEKFAMVAGALTPLALGITGAYLGYKSQQTASNNYRKNYATYVDANNQLGITSYAPNPYGGAGGANGIYGSTSSPWLYGLYGGLAGLSGLGGGLGGGGISIGVGSGMGYGYPSYGYGYGLGSNYPMGGMSYGYPYGMMSPVSTMGIGVYGGTGYPYGVPPGLVGGGYPWVNGGGYPGMGGPGMGGMGGQLIISGGLGNNSGMGSMFPYGAIGPNYGGNGMVVSGMPGVYNSGFPVYVPSVMGPQSMYPTPMYGNGMYSNPYGMNLTAGIGISNPYAMGGYGMVSPYGMGMGYPGMGQGGIVGIAGGYPSIPGMGQGGYPGMGYAGMGVMIDPMFGAGNGGYGMGYPGMGQGWVSPGSGMGYGMPGGPGGGGYMMPYGTAISGSPYGIMNPYSSYGQGAPFISGPAMYPNQMNGFPGMMSYPTMYGQGGMGVPPVPGMTSPMTGWGNAGAAGGMYNPYYQGSYGNSFGQMYGQMNGLYGQMGNAGYYSQEMMSLQSQMAQMQARYYNLMSQYGGNYGYGYGNGYGYGYPYGYGYGGGGAGCWYGSNAPAGTVPSVPSGPYSTCGSGGPGGAPGSAPGGSGAPPPVPTRGDGVVRDHRT